MDKSLSDPDNKSAPLSEDPDEDLEALAFRALTVQVAFLRGELARVWGQVDDRDRALAELLDVVATRDQQIIEKDEELRRHAAYIHRLSWARRLVPRSAKRTGGGR